MELVLILLLVLIALLMFYIAQLQKTQALLKEKDKRVILYQEDLYDPLWYAPPVWYGPPFWYGGGGGTYYGGHGGHGGGHGGHGGGH